MNILFKLGLLALSSASFASRTEPLPLDGTSRDLHEKLVKLVATFASEDFEERTAAVTEAHRVIARVNQMDDQMLRRRVTLTFREAFRHPDFEVRSSALKVRSPWVVRIGTDALSPRGGEQALGKSVLRLRGNMRFAVLLGFENLETFLS